MLRSLDPTHPYFGIRTESGTSLKMQETAAIWEEVAIVKEYYV